MNILTRRASSVGVSWAAMVDLPANAEPAYCAVRAINIYAKLLDCTTIDDARAHQTAVQAIANANGGTRADGTPGNDAGDNYVVKSLESADYAIIIQ